MKAFNKKKKPRGQALGKWRELSTFIEGVYVLNGYNVESKTRRAVHRNSIVFKMYVSYIKGGILNEKY